MHLPFHCTSNPKIHGKESKTRYVLLHPAATNALDHQADIAKVQEWLGHANISTTRIYDHRKTRREDSLNQPLDGGRHEASGQAACFRVFA